MLRLLSIRNFVVVEALDLELDRGFTVLTGETGAGKSILLDALALLLGDRFEQRQLRPGADRAELAAAFDVDDRPDVAEWLALQGLAGDAAPGDSELLRPPHARCPRQEPRVDQRPPGHARPADGGRRAAGRSARPACPPVAAHRRRAARAGRRLRRLRRARARRRRRVARVARRRREARRRGHGRAGVRRGARSARRARARARRAQRHAGRMDRARRRRNRASPMPRRCSKRRPPARTSSPKAMRRSHAVWRRIVARLARGRRARPGAGRRSSRCSSRRGSSWSRRRAALRAYRQKLDLDPAELARVEERLAAIHDAARRYRVRPEALPELLTQTQARLAAIAESADVAALAKRAAEAEGDAARARRPALEEARNSPPASSPHRVTAAMQDLAMAGGRFEIALDAARRPPASHGQEQVEFRVASHPEAAARPARARGLGRRALAHRARDPGGDERGRRRARR